MPGLRIFKNSFYSKIGANQPISGGTLNMGSLRGRGSTTRMFNYYKKKSTNASEYINQFINIKSEKSPEQNNPCDLLPKDTPYQLYSPSPQFGGIDNKSSRFIPILASQTGILNILYKTDSTKNFQASTSPAIANDGTIYVGYNSVIPYSLLNIVSEQQGYLLAFNSNGSVKWTFSLPSSTDSSYNVQSYFQGSTPTIGSDGTIYFGITTNNPGNGYDSPVGSTSVYAINPDGTIKWFRNDIVPADAPQYPPNNANQSVNITAPIVIGSDNNLYFGCYTNTLDANLSFVSFSSLFSLDSITGKTNWEFKLSSVPNNLIYSTIIDNVCIDNNGNIYFICIYYNLNISLINLISLYPNGTIRYICDLNNGNENIYNIIPYGRPVLSTDNSTVYAITNYYHFHKSYFHSINTQNGLINFILPISDYSDFNDNNGINNTIARDNNNNFYFSITDISYNRVIYSINKNGSTNWTYTINSYNSTLGTFVIINNAPVIGLDGTIYYSVIITDYSLTFNNYIYALNNNGTLKWIRLLSNKAYN